jgi:hypothetical protein
MILLVISSYRLARSASARAVFWTSWFSATGARVLSSSPHPSRRSGPHSHSRGVAGCSRRRGQPRRQTRPQEKAFPSQFSHSRIGVFRRQGRIGASACGFARRVLSQQRPGCGSWSGLMISDAHYIIA